MANHTHILLVEDDENFGSLLQNYLKLSGYEVTWCKDGAKGYSAFRNTSYDVCMLDVMMPVMDGFTLAEKIRERDQNIPLIFLTARGMKEDQLKGYRIGADDYLTKPFDVEVLLLKLDVLLKRGKNQQVVEHYTIGEFQFNATTRLLSHAAGERKLSPKEGALLHLLCQHLNGIMPREHALKTIWHEDSYFTTRSMDVYVTKLRKYLKADPAVRIENVHSSGYGLFVETA